MGFFDRFGKKKEEAPAAPASAVVEDFLMDDKEYESTIEADQTLITSILDRNVSVIVKGENNWDYFIDYAVYICFDHDTMNKILTKLRTRKGADLGAVTMRFGNVLNSAAWNGDCKAVFLLGLQGEKQVIARKDLVPIKDMLEGYARIYQFNTGENDLHDTMAYLRLKWMYIIGALPRADEDGKRDKNEAYTVKRTKFAGIDYVECYLSKENAKRYANGELVTSVRLTELVDFCGTVIVEPYSSNWMTFGGRQYTAEEFFFNQGLNYRK